jgi:ABC-2 type transport system ATP-binding protein
MEGAAVACRGLTKHYGDVVALSGLDLEIAPGTVFGFLGPNGAGKTTTLRLLTGLARPTAGTATVAGTTVADASGPSASARVDGAGHATFGYLDQDPRFYGWMRGRELLGLVADLYGLDRSERRARIGEILEVVGLSEAANRRIGGYSGGMRQRLGLAAALLPRPSVLFLDEPVSALDPAGRHDLLEVIGRLRGATTVFMSTHILNDVERVCERVAILDRGRLLVDAPIDDLLARYAAPVYRLEPEAGEEAALGSLADRIRAAPWATTVSTADGTLRVHVTDPRVAGPALFGLIADSGIAPAVVERQIPTLEDVFLRIVEGSAP